MQREALASVAGLESGMAAKQEAVSAADDAVKAHLLEVSTPSRLHGPKPSLDVFACLPACQVTAGTSLILNHLKMKCRPKYPQAHCLLSLSVIALSLSIPAWCAQHVLLHMNVMLPERGIMTGYVMLIIVLS